MSGAEVNLGFSVFRLLIDGFRDYNNNQDLELDFLEQKLCQAWKELQSLGESQLQGNETNNAQAVLAINTLKRWCYDAEDLVEKRRVQRNTSLTMQTFNEIWNRLTKKQDIVRVKNLIENYLGTLSGRNNQSQATSNQCNGDRSNDVLIGRKSDIEAILQKLSSYDECKYGVSIVGMCGVGKSLLAENIFKNQKIADEYPQKFKIEIKGGKFDLGDINEIQRQASSKLNTKTLIVLDNLQHVEHNVWYCFERFMGEQFEKGNVKIIVTTRNPTISKMKCLIPHELGLSNKICGEVIKSYADYYNKIPTETCDLDAIIKRSVDKCEGLPMVARWIGIFIKHKNKDDLENSIGREGRLSEMIEFKREIFPKLMSAYIGIRPELWRCLAYLSLLPVGHKFSIDDLVHLWVGECFIKQPEGTKTLEHIKMDYVKDLQERSILQSSGKLNSFGQDFATLAASGTCLQLGQGSTSIKTAFNEMTRHLSIPTKDFNNKNWTELQKIKKLRTVLSLYDDNNDDDRKAASQLQKVQLVFSEKISGLRVLSLKGITIRDIPSSIGNLKLLRYFDISFTPVTNFPTELKSELQFLKFKGTRISNLREKLHKLKNLIYIDWDEEFLKDLAGLYNVGKLSKLENLPLFKVDNKEGYWISELKEMNKLQGSLHIQNLENVTNITEAKNAMLNMKHGLVKIGLEWTSISSKSDVAENVLRVLEPHKLIKELKLVRYGGKKFPDWIKGSCLEKIQLKECELCPFFPVLGELKNLNVLLLDDMESITELSCRSPDDTQAADPLFPALKSLELNNMTQLQKMTGLQTGDMPCIRKFKAAGCTAIADLFADFALETADLARKQGIIKSIFENKGWGHTLEIKIDDVILQDGTITQFVDTINMV